MSFREVVEIAEKQDEQALNAYIDRQAKLPKFQKIVEEYRDDNESQDFSFVLNETFETKGFLYSPVAYLVEQDQLEAAFFLLEHGASAAYACYYAAIKNDITLLTRLFQYQGSSLNDAMRGAGAAKQISLINTLRDRYPNTPPHEYMGAAMFGHFEYISEALDRSKDEPNFQKIMCIVIGIVRNRNYRARDKVRLLEHYLSFDITYPESIRATKKEQIQAQLIENIFFIAGIENQTLLVELLNQRYSGYMEKALQGAAQGNSIHLISYFLYKNRDQNNFKLVLETLPKDHACYKQIKKIARGFSNSYKLLFVASTAFFFACALTLLLLGVAFIFLHYPLTPIITCFLGAGLSVISMIVVADYMFSYQRNYAQLETSLETLAMLKGERSLPEDNIRLDKTVRAAHQKLVEKVPLSKLSFFKSNNQYQAEEDEPKPSYSRLNSSS